MVDASPSPLREAHKNHFNNKNHSDVTVMVEDSEFYGNIEVLSRKSQYFNAMFRSKMRESIEGVVVKVACGSHHTVVLTSTGKLLTWYAMRRQMNTSIIRIKNSLNVLIGVMDIMTM